MNVLQLEFFLNHIFPLIIMSLVYAKHILHFQDSEYRCSQTIAAPVKDIVVLEKPIVAMDAEGGNVM